MIGNKVGWHRGAWSRSGGLVKGGEMGEKREKRKEKKEEREGKKEK